MNDNSWMENPSNPFQVIAQKMMSTFEQKRFYYGSIWICQWQPAINYSSRLYCKVLFIYDIIDRDLILTIMYSYPPTIGLLLICVCVSSTHQLKKPIHVCGTNQTPQRRFLLACVCGTYLQPQPLLLAVWGVCVAPIRCHSKSLGV